jgi:voltage-gated potassium channel
MAAPLPTDEFTRLEKALTIALAAVSAGFLVALYYLLPFAAHPRESIWWKLVIVVTVFAIALGHELNSILRHRQPMRRAIVALAVLFPLFVVMYAWIYLTMSRSDPAAFGEVLSRTEALYFTVTVLATVGFGDITPKTDPARLLVTTQMVADLILIAVVVRLILGAASRAGRSEAEDEDNDADADA